MSNLQAYDGSIPTGWPGGLRKTAGILYLIGTRRKELLWFVLLVVSAILMTVADDDKILLMSVPVDYAWNVRLVYLSFAAISASLVRCAASLFSEFVKPGAFRWFYAICAISGLLIVFTPPKLKMELGYLHFFVPFLAGLIVYRLSFRSLAQGNANAIFLLLGITSVLANILGTLGKGSLWPDTGYYPIDLIVAFLAFASYWFRRYFRLSEQSVRLAEGCNWRTNKRTIFWSTPPMNCAIRCMAC